MTTKKMTLEAQQKEEPPYADNEDVNYLYDYSKRLQNAFKVLNESTIISAGDKQLSRDFVAHLEALGVSVGRRAKYLFHLKVILEHLSPGVDVKLAKRSDIEELMRWAREHYESVETRGDVILVIKRFWKFAKYGNVDLETPYPPEVSWLRKTIKKNERKEPEFFTPEEMEALIRAADRPRDRAMIAVSGERGLRPGELLLLDVGDISFDEIGARIRIRHSKTGGRTIRIITSSSNLSRYLEQHPLREYPNAPLWLSETSNRKNYRLKWSSWSRILKKIAVKAKVNHKKIKHYLLRHGSATEAAKFLTDAELDANYGWVFGSRTPGTYIHMTARDTDEKLARIYAGKRLEPVKPSFSPVPCRRCNEKNIPGVQFCGRCGLPLDESELVKPDAELQEMKQKLDDLIRRLESREKVP